MEIGEKPQHVLFLCTGNSARSIFSEAIMNAMANGRFVAHSAGSHPAGSVNPMTIELLQKNRLPADGLRSKSWGEFAQPGAPPLDFVFTVCDDAAGEVSRDSRTKPTTPTPAPKIGKAQSVWAEKSKGSSRTE